MIGDNVGEENFLAQVGLDALVLVGPSGSGKTTVGLALAARFGARFIDADDHHTSANIEKMARGEGLTDEERQPWLQSLAHLLHESEAKNIVLACSALKRTYRQKLTGKRRVYFLGLSVAGQHLELRLRDRQSHFAGRELLKSQLATWEQPEKDSGLPEGWILAEGPLQEVLERARAHLVARYLERGSESREVP